jgi:hypothetical protein
MIVANDRGRGTAWAPILPSCADGSLAIIGRTKPRALSPDVTGGIQTFSPRFHTCPTDPADTIGEHDGKRELVEMRWGLVPFWWSKPLKELRLATFKCSCRDRDHKNRSSVSRLKDGSGTWQCIGAEVRPDWSSHVNKRHSLG